MDKILQNILILAYTLSKDEINFTETEKRVFKEFMQALEMDPAEFKAISEPETLEESLQQLSSKEQKTLLLDILMLLTLSQGNMEKEHVVFLFKALHKINLPSSDYLVFPANISFDEFVKRQDLNLDNLYRMLWTKVAHVMRKRIFLPQWSNNLACGITNVDRQHKALIDHFASYVIKLQLNNSIGEIKKMLSFLQEYANQHFSTEEALMKETKYPQLESHLQAHQQFRQMFFDLLEAFKLDKDLKKLRDGLSDILTWFLNHIRQTDIPSCFFMRIKQASTVRKNQLLIYHDEPEELESFFSRLSSLGIDRQIKTILEKEAWDWIQTGDIALVIIFNNGKLFKGVDLLSRIRKNNKQTPVLLVPTVLNQNDLAASVKRQRLNHPQNQTLLYPFEPADLVAKLKNAIFGS